MKNRHGEAGDFASSLTYPLADLQKLVQTDLDAVTASVNARAAYATQIALERLANQKANPTLRLLKNYVLALIGDTQDAAAALAEFGYEPRKARKRSAKSKAQAADKAQATREAKKPVDPAAKAETPPAQQGTTQPPKG
jgi:hypothetical protein